MEIGQALSNLHTSRKNADYEMGDAQFEDQDESSDCIARAEQILDGLASCATVTMKQKVKAGILQYRQLNRIIGK